LIKLASTFHCAESRTAVNEVVNKIVDLSREGAVLPLREDALANLDRPKGRSIVRIHLLGPMRATTYLGANILPHGKRARAILGYLCLTAGEHVQRAALARLLWDRVPGAAARTNLRQALRELSSAFGKFAHELIVSGRDVIRINADACWIDALAVLGLDPAAPGEPHGDLRALCRGEFLEGLDGASASFDRWLLGQRTRLAEHFELLLQRRLEEAEPKSSESRGLKRALADAHERAQALRGIAQYREARHKLLLPPTDSTGNGGEVPQRHADQRPAPSRDRLRVGVLPFLANGSANEDNLAFSLSQEVATALARFRWFDVIAPISLRPPSSMRIMDEHQLRRMDLDYVVEGTVSSNGKYFRINVRLMDFAEYARPVWGESFDLACGELHQLNELVTARIVARIDPIILFIEGRPKRRERYGATGLLLLAIPLIFTMERRKFDQAGDLIRKALEMDPDNAMVAAWAAHWHLFYVGQGWARDTKGALERVQEYALRAIKLDPENAEALAIYAHYCSFAEKDFDTALHYFDRALRLNPSLAFGWALSAPTYCYIGEPEVALERLERYRDLAPFDPHFSWFETLYTIAYMFRGDYERAVIVGRRAVKAHPNFVNSYKPLIASLGHLGRREEAKPYIAKLLSLEPDFTVERFAQVYPLKKASDRRRYMKGLLLAGVPAR
jgi:DNA-binding SARP family transcriptional activator/TolB-like protein